MGRRERRDKASLEQMGFKVTKVLFCPPSFTPLPSVYLDESSGRWAVKYPLQPALINELSKVRGCFVLEDGGSGGNRSLSGRNALSEALLRPWELSKRNALRHDMVLGIGVVVCMDDGTPEGDLVSIPLFVRELRRASILYRRLMNEAERLKNELLGLSERQECPSG